MFDSLMGLFSNDLAIDLGTANTLIYVKGKGIIINEPSVVAIKRANGKQEVLAVGKEAKDMIGKTPHSIEAVRPIKDGVIADFDVTEKMIRYFIEKAHKRRSFLRPRIAICVPYGLTQVERKAVKESAMSAGARGVYLIEEPLAAAIGAGIVIKEPFGSLIIDIGGGTTEIGVISLGGLVVSKSIRVAGDKIEQSIVSFMKERYNLLIGAKVSESIKIGIGSAIQLKNNTKMSVKGRDQVTGLLSTICITSEDIRQAIMPPLESISDALKQVLEQTPPDLASDIIETGASLTGGGALIRGIDKYLSKVIELPVNIVDEPLLAVAKGTGEFLDEISRIKKIDYD